MILNEYGKSFEYDGRTFTIGEQIVGNNQSEYDGLVGVITEIRDGEDKETENETPDIYCNFDEPILPKGITELENRFSDLYDENKTIEDIILDCVIMAPYMIVPTSQKHEGTKTITVYAVLEDWAVDGEHHSLSTLFSSYEDAVKEFRLRVAIEANDGIISDLKSKTESIEEFDPDSYECYIDGFYNDERYSISIKEKTMCISESFMCVITDTLITKARIDDFIEQIEEWEEISALTKEQYKELISKPEIADRISSALTMNDSYFEAYCLSVSEVAHQVVNEYLKEVSMKNDNI